MRYRILLLCLLGMTMASGLHAQRKANDKEKQRQWRSMENGPWNFAPDWYYFFLHKKYSGAEMYWKWAGFQSGFRVRFKEHKSNVKRIMPTRVMAEETQRQKIKKVEEERQKMEELYQGRSLSATGFFNRVIGSINDFNDIISFYRNALNAIGFRPF